MLQCNLTNLPHWWRGSPWFQDVNVDSSASNTLLNQINRLLFSFSRYSLQVAHHSLRPAVQPTTVSQLTKSFNLFQAQPVYQATPLQFHYQPQPQRSFPSAPKNWCELLRKDHVIYLNLQGASGCDPAVIKSLTIWLDGSWKFRRYGDEVPLEQFPPRLTDTESMEGLLSYVDQIRLCPGNPDPRFMTLLDRRDGKLTNGAVFNHVVSEVDKKTNKLCTFMKTIRHNECPITLDTIAGRCKQCTDFGGSLRKLLSRQSATTLSREMRTAADSKTPLTALQQDELLERAKNLVKVVKTTKQKVNRLMQKVIHQDISTDGIDIGDEHLSASLQQVMEEDTKKIEDHFPPDTFGHLFWQQQKKMLNKADARGNRWHPMIIKWCINMRMASGKAYNILRKVLRLPHDTTLKSYIHWTEPTSGLTLDSVLQMCREMKVDQLAEHQKYLVVVHDEMKVQANLVYSKGSGRLVGFTKLEGFEDQLRAYEDQLQETDKPEESLAEHVLVFQVRGIFWNFQYPVAHFPTTNTKGHEIFSIFWRLVEVLEMVGFKVVAVTCDGASTNRSFMDMHGRSTVADPICRAINPYDEDYTREVFLLNDPPHLLKCARNAWENKKRALWVSEKQVRTGDNPIILNFIVKVLLILKMKKRVTPNWFV